jgi:uncharacterized protein
MRQYERGGVTIDQCGECRGVFLDRGELEHLIDAETRWSGRGPSRPDDHEYGYDPGHRDDHYGYDPRHHRKKKRKSFFEELFDD